MAISTFVIAGYVLNKLLQLLLIARLLAPANRRGHRVDETAESQGLEKVAAASLWISARSCISKGGSKEATEVGVGRYSEYEKLDIS